MPQKRQRIIPGNPRTFDWHNAGTPYYLSLEIVNTNKLLIRKHNYTVMPFSEAQVLQRPHNHQIVCWDYFLSGKTPFAMNADGRCFPNLTLDNNFMEVGSS